MARYGKRRKPGPSKNEQKVARAHRSADMARMAGVVGERFPGVKKIAIRLEFFDPQGQLFDHQERSLGPSDPCDLAVPCPGRCGSGSFDLAAKLRSVVEARETISESSAVCPVPIYAGAATACGFKLTCKIEVAYLPLPQPSETTS